jgi:hypothetical protein
MGGLGNYLFQIGAACTLAHKNNDAATFDFDSYIQVHKDINSYKTNILRNINTEKPQSTHRYNEASNFLFNEIPYHPNLQLYGYFQSEKYLDRSYILDLYKIDENTNSYISTKYSSLLNTPNLVSVHVRRGDYLEKQDRHPVQTIEYYRTAFEYFDNATYVVFSDDIEWCKTQFSNDTFVFIENEPDFVDLYLMSMCNHNIIANSSFSWWGAYLNNHTDKRVIAPSTWFGSVKQLVTDNIYCEGWVIV